MRYRYNKQNLALATAALGAGTGLVGQADAALISTAPAGFSGTTVYEADLSSTTFDVSGTGIGVFTLQGKNTVLTKISLSAPTGGGVSNIAGLATATSAPLTGTFSGNADIAEADGSNFGASPLFGSVSYLDGATVRNGYLKGTFASRSFTLQDYGQVTDDVPEPETWALLALGMGGIGTAMRRRRRADAKALAEAEAA